MQKLRGSPPAPLLSVIFHIPFLIQIIAVASFFVAKAFFTVYEMGVDTIFICICKSYFSTLSAFFSVSHSTQFAIIALSHRCYIQLFSNHEINLLSRRSVTHHLLALSRELRCTHLVPLANYRKNCGIWFFTSFKAA